MIKLYSAKMLLGHGIYLTGDSHKQRRHSWFSKSRVAPTAPEIRLGLGMGSWFCRGYSGITFNIGSDSACLNVRKHISLLSPKTPSIYLTSEVLYCFIARNQLDALIMRIIGPPTAGRKEYILSHKPLTTKKS